VSRWICALVLALAPLVTMADDEEALSLADQATSAPDLGSAWRIFTEGALRESRQRGGSEVRGARLSLDVRYEKGFAPGWRAAFSDRLDATQLDDPSGGDNVNTLKEAYVSWQPRADRLVDAGRINARYGVATGYNPTDYFKAGSVRSIVSIEPASLRENRLGTAMARVQALWDEGSIAALYSPKLVAQPTSSAFSPDFGATNANNRWLVAGSRRFGEFNPQWLVFGGEGMPLQFGVNATALAGEATVAYVEWSGGRSRSLLSQALGLDGDSAFRSRTAAGLTYTAAFKLTMTAEYEYNGAGLDRAGWNALSRGSPLDYARYRNYASTAQDLPTQENLFLYAIWQDALITHLDLSAMQRRDPLDGSRLSWVEVRFRLPRADVALQWQRASGSALSDFGAAQDARLVQAVVRYYF